MTYAITGWIIIQIATNVFPVLEMPEWTTKFVILLVLIGFPIALVFAWAFEITPDGIQRTRDVPEHKSISHETGGSLNYWIIGLLSLAVILLVAERVWWAGTYQVDNPSTTSKGDKASIAVLPFQVSGSGAEEWSDGMVTMLSTGLDGVAGLRAIADRTIFAALGQIDEKKKAISSSEALSIARNLDATYAIIGSAVKLGENLRFVAEVHESQSGSQLGQVKVKGSPERVTALADSLTRLVLEVLLQKSSERVSSVNLEALTTSSLPALKAFLEGERHFRAGKYGKATADYETAIERDTSFALAYARLAYSYSWLRQYDKESQLLKRAYALSDRLPERDRKLVQARMLWRVRKQSMAAADSLRDLSERYPDDSRIWHELGENLFHNSIPGGYPEAEDAFRKAIELNPEPARYHHHYINLGFTLHRDSLLVANRIKHHPEKIYRQNYRLGLNLVFGNKRQKQKALQQLDSVSIPDYNFLPFLFGHPFDWDLKEKVISTLYSREDIASDDLTNAHIVSLVQQGKISQAITEIKAGGWNENIKGPLAYWMSVGIHVPDSLARINLEPKNLPSDVSVNQLKFSSLYVIQQGREEDVEVLFNRIEAAVDSAKGQISRERIKAILKELKGYRALQAGNLKKAEKLLHHTNKSYDVGALWRGDLYRELGQLKRAEEWYRAAWNFPVTHKKLGELYEMMNQPDKAAAAYRRFIEAWKNADPALQNQVKRARKRLQVLTTSEGEPTKQMLQ